MDEEALDRLIALIGELERMFAEAKDDPKSPAWREMQKRIEEIQEQIARLRAH